MSILLNFNILILIILSIVLLSVSNQRQDDRLCPNISSVPCVKDVLLNISSAATEINDIAQKIEHIRSNVS